MDGDWARQAPFLLVRGRQTRLVRGIHSDSARKVACRLFNTSGFFQGESEVVVSLTGGFQDKRLLESGWHRAQFFCTGMRRPKIEVALIVVGGLRERALQATDAFVGVALLQKGKRLNFQGLGGRWVRR